MTTTNRTKYIPIEERLPATVRAVILARSSDPSAKPEDMQSQVQQCLDFIAQQGWTLVADAYTYCESKTGMRDVVRPMLDAVLKLAASQAIDVIVCREFERVARSKGRRYQAIQTAADFGVEFRFANQLPDGKLPDSAEARLMQDVKEWMAEAEAEKISERMQPGKDRRLADGLPHGGSTGPAYGYKNGERKLGKHDKPMGVLNWLIDEEKAYWVHWLFDTVDALAPADISIGDLARQLSKHGAPTASGTSLWGRVQVRNMLRNRKYCGLGRNNRYDVYFEPERDSETGQVRQTRHVRDRQRDAEAWKSETYTTVGIPVIIDPEQFQRVQDKLKDAAKLVNHGTITRTDAVAHSTLLNPGYIRCAECGRKMNRYWSGKVKTPYYQCNVHRWRPTDPHKSHSIIAGPVDALALRLLAYALTNPEFSLKLADTAEKQYADAQTDTALADADVAVAAKRVAEIDAQQEAQLKVIKLLRGMPGTEHQVDEARAKLAALDAEKEEAKHYHTHAVPRQERATLRQQLLDQLKAGGMFLGYTLDGAYHPVTAMPLHMAVEVIGLRRLFDRMNEERVANGLEAEWESELYDWGYRILCGEPEDEWAEFTGNEWISHLDLATHLLKHMPRADVRALLAKLDAVVLVSRPRPRHEWVKYGKMPIEDRVTLRLLGEIRIRLQPSGDGDGGCSGTKQIEVLAPG